MFRSLLFFSLAAGLSFGTFLFKSEHHYDLHLVVPVGLYFIGAFLLAFRPEVEAVAMLKFTALAMLLWLGLFLISFNLLFFVTAPLSGVLGAWLILLLSERFLGQSIPRRLPVVLTGAGAVVLGLAFMILVKELPKDVYTIGLKAGVMVGLWQLGVGVQVGRGRKD